MEIWWVQRDLGVLWCNFKLLISVINYASPAPLKSTDHPSSGCHSVWWEKKKGGGQPGEKNKENCSGLARMNQSFQENQQNPSYSITITSLPRFCIKHPHLTSVYRCCFKSRLRSRVEACDWTPRAAPELYFEEEATKPQIMLHSPQGSTMAIRLFFFSSHFVRHLKKTLAFPVFSTPSVMGFTQRKKQALGCPVRGREQ